ncbi:MAG: M48 family metalloprotease [Ignavibacteriae bacterium]|nr:M48 family metalloprotease [Ignavibacteriota bacterium]MCB9243152.1 M48 family metalloprotease [Ignavibacteriales bacterium]
MEKLILKLRDNSALYSFIVSLLFLVSTAVFYSCGANIFSEEDDVAIGRDLDRQIKSDPRQFPMLQGHQDIKDYVNGIGKDILTKSNYIRYEGIFPYTFQIINDTVVNAFCTPGGFIYIYTGLMKFVNNEATLAGVVGHEIAHAERRHMTQRLTAAYSVNAIASLVLGGNPNMAAQIFANLFVGLGFLANSRADEEEADDYSIRYLASTEYYPGAITFFFDKIREEQKKKGTTPGDLERLLSTHPLPQDRIDNVKEEIKKMKLKVDPTKGLFTERYQQIKAKLP